MDVERSIAEHFEAQASCFENRLAIKEAEVALNYGQLNRLANHVALEITGKEESMPGAVAILVDHGVGLPVAVMAVLKANGFYVQLSTDAPHDLKLFCLEDAEAGILLTDRKHRLAAQALARESRRDVRIIEVDAFGPEARTGPTLLAEGHEVCCLVYTSGSSGRPKSVIQLHRNLLHHISNYTQQAGLIHHDRLSFVQSLTVISGATALFGALLNGACLFPFQPQRCGLIGMARWIEEERLTCLHMVPTLFRHLGNFAVRKDRQYDHVRLLRLGGEAVMQSDLELCLTLFGNDCRLLTGLSSTETLDIRMNLFGAASPKFRGSLPLGEPVADKDSMLLDAAGQAPPDGEVGEIHVSSEYLFAGYWRQDELTARVLTTDRQDSKKKVFRTGDLARTDGQGNLFHVGRADAQQKIRGHRVDLSQIEHAIRQIPKVDNAVVILGARRGAPAAIHAYVTCKPGTDLDTDVIRRHMRQRFPRHAVPASIQLLPRLPLLPGGKVDRRLLLSK